MDKNETDKLDGMLKEISKDASEYARKIMETIGEYSGKEALGLVLALEIIKEVVMKETEIPEELMKELKENAVYNVKTERHEDNERIYTDQQ